MNEYYDSPYTEEFMEGIAEGMTGFDLVSNVWSLIVSIFVYVFMAIGMYAIAKRRGINHPWLAWIPLGSTWLLGCISDQYRYVVMGQEKSKRKVMLGLEIAVSATGAVSIVLLVVAFIKLFSRMDSYLGELPSGSMVEDTSYFAEVLSPLIIALILCFVMLGLAIALTVLTYMALYDLFRSCDPAHASVFLVLSIVLNLFGVGSILQAIFVFACRNKDLGMPPRRDQVLYTQPVWQSVEPPVWQPQQPSVEPWEQNNDQF